jgi:aryl-alcohol dehydrogenase-like predicted oxidoreductase
MAKAVLTFIRGIRSAEQLAKLFENVTIRKPTTEEMEKLEAKLKEGGRHVLRPRRE